MNIKRKNKKNVVDYGDVMIGEIFEICNTIYLKIEPIANKNGAVFDCIELETGEIQENFLKSIESVVLLNATLMIED